MPTELRLNSRRTGDVAIVAASGEIDLSTCPQAEAALSAARGGVRQEDAGR